MGLVFVNSLLPHSKLIKHQSSNKKLISRRLSLKRLTPSNQRYLISLGFQVRK